MTMFAIALTVTAIIGGATAPGAFQKSPNAQPVEDEATDLSITQSEVVPGWFITPAQARMW